MMSGNKDSNYHKRRWLTFAVSGLLCTGAGLSMAVDAAFCKYEGHSWFWYGTTSLVVFNLGLCLIGQSVYHKCKI